MTAAFATTAHATLNTSAEHGEKTVQIAVPGGRRPEICVIPKHYAGANYSKKDLETEQILCQANEYENAAVCPKLNSTNPGLNFFAIPDGSSPDSIEAKGCSKDAGAKKLAKYKLSTSCSYTPSIVGYYHVSRILGGIVNVPPAVVRTFDLKHHLEIGNKALSEVKKGDIIEQTWSGLLSQLRAGAAAKKKDQLLTDALDQSYGGFLAVPKGNVFYKEFFNGGAENITRAQKFRDGNPIFALVKSPASVEKLVGQEFNAANLQRMVQMRDAADMIVIDTLMNQQDRFGNIDTVTKYYFFDKSDVTDDGAPMLKAESKAPTDASLNAIAVKEMILQDNDCGVAKDNIAKQAGLAGLIRHIDPGVYHRLQKLNGQIGTPETRAFFTQVALFTPADFTGFRKNLNELAANLKSACESGQLKLDLDLQAHFSGKAASEKTSCD